MSRCPEDRAGPHGQRPGQDPLAAGVSSSPGSSGTFRPCLRWGRGPGVCPESDPILHVRLFLRPHVQPVSLDAMEGPGLWRGDLQAWVCPQESGWGLMDGVYRHHRRQPGAAPQIPGDPEPIGEALRPAQPIAPASPQPLPTVPPRDLCLFPSPDPAFQQALPFARAALPGPLPSRALRLSTSY